MLGRNRNTISSWLSLYETQGLEKFLEIYRPPGVKTKISEAALEEIKAMLGTEKGSRTYKETGLSYKKYVLPSKPLNHCCFPIHNYFFQKSSTFILRVFVEP